MSMPTNPLYDALRNWQRVATEMLTTWRARAETVRSQFYSRFYGPQPTARIFPLRRMRMATSTGRVPMARGGVIPHASIPGVEKYDFTYSKGASQTPPFTTSRRLGVEGEPYDFTY